MCLAGIIHSKLSYSCKLNCLYLNHFWSDKQKISWPCPLLMMSPEKSYIILNVIDGGITVFSEVEEIYG